MSVIEQKESRSYNANQGIPNADRVFVVTDMADESEIIAIMDGGAGNLPAPDEKYPANTPLPVDLIFYDYSIAKMPESPRMWRVTCRYKPAETGGTISVETRPTEIGYRTVSGQLKATFQDRWRIDDSPRLTYPTLFNVTNLTADIGGTKIDFVGRPLSSLVFQQALTIQVVDGSIPNMGDSGIAGAIGKRNDSIFLGAAAGQVVFTGCNFERVPDVHRFTISYEFLFDGEGHLLQVPSLDSKGQVHLDTNGNAEAVMFRQPFTRTTNFMNLTPYFSGL